MGFKLLPIFTFLSLALVAIASHAVLAPEAYWKKVLPNTPMPKAVTELLHNEWTEEKSTNIGVSKAVSLHENQGVAIYFLEKDMSPGTKMNLQFRRHETEVGFLPRPITKSIIPFSSDKLPEILNRFSVQPESEEAEIIKKTIKRCEDPAFKGEDKYCATSLESMVDHSTSRLGKSVEAISTEVDRQSQLQQYTITGVVKKTAGDKAVVCHKQDYPYAVFYCHTTQTTKAYKVSLVGADGTKADAVAVCHTDTSEWNPKHLAFQLLKVKPGTVPICHFLPEDHVVWVPK
ncbi:BURP domain [Dillenia turbinata]|uniref:BURP domain n=1 Tax=Dillenia turbinata TaxID=194707 RepID=A0AAN8Z770_9MAGN